MNIIRPYIEIIDKLDGQEVLKKIELCGRTCYKSEGLINEDSCDTFVKNIIKRGHESVLEHHNISIRIVCDRGVSHELVRHRIASYSQESTRYCNYGKSELTFIQPCYWDNDKDLLNLWEFAMQDSETWYLELLRQGALPQEARGVLPNSLKTEVVATMNIRSWRHFLKLRCHRTSHPQMIEIALMILQQLHQEIPIVFDDIYDLYKHENYPFLNND